MMEIYAGGDLIAHTLGDENGCELKVVAGVDAIQVSNHKSRMDLEIRNIGHILQNYESELRKNPPIIPVAVILPAFQKAKKRLMELMESIKEMNDDFLDKNAVIAAVVVHPGVVIQICEATLYIRDKFENGVLFYLNPKTGQIDFKTPLIQ